MAVTNADLVVLSLLAEGPRHGYGIQQELERRQASEWANVSKPQIYYSLKKLHRERLIRAAGDHDDSSIGPERQTWKITKSGKEALADALNADAWAEQRPAPPFLTWLALSWAARPETRWRMLDRRARFLREELDRERATLEAVIAEVGPDTDAAWMLRLTLRHFEMEIEWLDALRASRNPAEKRTMRMP